MNELEGVWRFQHEAMDTTFAIGVRHPDCEYCRQASDAAFAEIDRLDSLLSRYNPAGDIGRLNRLHVGESMYLAPDTYDVLTISLEYMKTTQGAFNINVGALADYAKTSDSMNQKMKWPAALDLACLQLTPPCAGGNHGLQGFRAEIVGGPSDQTLQLDLGAIAKGYALEQAALVLEEWGLQHFFINGGNSTVLARGRQAPEPEPAGWLAHYGLPWSAERDGGVIRLHNEALSGSGVQERGRHIIDAAKQRPVARTLAVWVISPDATQADALSTAFFVMSKRQVQQYCRAHSPLRAFCVHQRQGKETASWIGDW